jgi:hypothetical protein
MIASFVRRATSWGRFRSDVEDEAAITSEDFEIDILTDADIGDFKYKCKKCGKEIAVLHEKRWTVHVGRGWIW